MSTKNFFKPTIIKIIVFVVLLIITIIMPKTDTQCNMTPNGVICRHVAVKGIGYPIFFGESYSGDAIDFGFSPTPFLLNVVIFYTISCLIVFGYNRLRNKSLNGKL